MGRIMKNAPRFAAIALLMVCAAGSTGGDTTPATPVLGTFTSASASEANNWRTVEYADYN